MGTGHAERQAPYFLLWNQYILNDETLSKRDFTTHMKDIHTPRVYMCDQCDYTAAREEYLKKHIKFTHDGEFLLISLFITIVYKLPIDLGLFWL